MSLLSGVMTGGLGAELVTDERGEVFKLTRDDVEYAYYRLTWTLVETSAIGLVGIEVRPAGPEYGGQVELEVKVTQTTMDGEFTIHRTTDLQDFMKDFGAVFSPPTPTARYQLTFVMKPAAKEMFTVWADSLMERGIL